MLLTDGSVNTQSNIGYGAYLAVSERGLSLDLLRTRVKVRRFEHTSSTKLTGSWGRATLSERYCSWGRATLSERYCR